MRSLTRDEIADEMLEARRYVRQGTDATRFDVERIKSMILKATMDNRINKQDALRYTVNLRVGVAYLQVDPEVLEGYLYSAAFELRCNPKGDVA